MYGLIEHYFCNHEIWHFLGMRADIYILKLLSNTWNSNCTLYATQFLKSLPGLSVIAVIYLIKIMMSFYTHI